MIIMMMMVAAWKHIHPIPNLHHTAEKSNTCKHCDMYYMYYSSMKKEPPGPPYPLDPSNPQDTSGQSDGKYKGVI